MTDRQNNCEAVRGARGVSELTERMKTIHLIFFDAGGGHRSAANALSQVIAEQQRPWRIEMLNLQEVFDSLDVFRKLTGMRMQDLYNSTLKRGWTLGSPQLTKAMHGIIRLYHRPQVKLLEKYWRQHSTDLVVSLIPNFNRALFESLRSTQAGTPLMTVLTDFADFPPHFWMEKQPQYLVCGTDHAVKQARALGYPEERIFQASGMILHPRFYEPLEVDRGAERRRLGLDAELPTGLVLFGGQGSPEMVEIAKRLSECATRMQLILLCGHNRKLMEQLRAMRTELAMPMHVEGFTAEVPYFMRLADFFVGKPGPGSISEALRMQLPVIVERNAWTLPQERYNAEWVQEQGVGMVLANFRDIGPAVEEMLAAENHARFRERTREKDNRAVFEIPDFLERVMTRTGVGSAALQA